MKFQSVQLDDRPIDIHGEYAVRLDQSLVLAPEKRLNRTLIDRYKSEKISMVKVYKSEAGNFPVTFPGPFQLQEHIGILIFDKISS